ncbi:MAG: DUF2279 domain-containing protein [bacterium]|nr:DUF2279 domain-containing protein [bacterium]
MCKVKLLCLFFILGSLQLLHAQQLDTLNKRRLRTVVALESGFYLTGNAYLQYVWYKDHQRAPFHFYNDNKGYLQIDKCGHAFGAYHYSRIGYQALRWAGVNRKKALIYGGPLGLVLQTPIEIFDGLYDGYGFSPGDMIANTFGSTLFTLQQAVWDDQIIKMKFSYAASSYPKFNPQGLGASPLESFFMDYNGHTYWLSANARKITGIKKLPDWLNIAVGYSANGMLSEFKNYNYYNYKFVPQLDRYRQWLFSLDIDLSKIKTKHKVLKSILTQLNVLKIPFPALEYNRINHFRFRPFYY